MRRGAGISSLSRQTASSASYATLSSTISSQQLTDLSSRLELFKSALLTFSTAHRADIRADPALRHQFQKMCAAIGVDPLAAGGGRKGGGWWGDLLGLGDWQYELAVQVVDVCVSTRERNGGMIEMGDLLARLGRLRGAGAGEVTAEDVVRCIKTLAPLGTGYELLTLSSQTFIRSVPSELDTDQSALLGYAGEHGGRIVESVVGGEMGWGEMRVRNGLENMIMREGVGWVDEQAGGREVWVPSAVKWEEG